MWNYSQTFNIHYCLKESTFQKGERGFVPGLLCRYFVGKNQQLILVPWKFKKENPGLFLCRHFLVSRFFPKHNSLCLVVILKPEFLADVVFFVSVVWCCDQVLLYNLMWCSLYQYSKLLSRKPCRGNSTFMSICKRPVLLSEAWFCAF